MYQNLTCSSVSSVGRRREPPLKEPLRKALERRSVERSRRRDGGNKGSGKSLGFLSAKGIFVGGISSQQRGTGVLNVAGGDVQASVQTG